MTPEQEQTPSPKSRKRRASESQDSKSQSSPRSVRSKPSPEAARSYHGRVLSSSEDGCRIWTDVSSTRSPLEASLRRYYDHTRSDRLLINRFFELMKTPCHEKMRGAIHLSGLVSPSGYTKVGHCNEGGTFDGRRSSILPCGVCGPPIFEDYSIFQTAYPGRVLALLHEFLYNQRRGMVCSSAEEIHGDYFEVKPTQVRHIVALLVHWTTLEPYSSLGGLKDEWRVKIRELRVRAQQQRKSLDPGQILIYREEEEMFKGFFVDGSVDHGLWDEQRFQVVKFEKSS